MLRTGKTSALRREALPIAEDMGISTARLRPVPVGAGKPAIIREIGHFCTASISQATLRRTETTELTKKAKFDRDPSAGLHGLLARVLPWLPKTGHHSVPFQRRGLREIGTALARLCLVAVTQSLTRRNFEAAPLTGLA